MPKCLICGYESRSLQPHLKHKHQMRVSEYYEKFNNSPVYDYNPADNIQKWAKENPEEYRKKQANAGRKAIVKVNKYLSENPEIRKEIARKGGKALAGANLTSWRNQVGSKEVSKYCAKAGHLSSLSKGHDYMAEVALRNNRYCKYPYKSVKFDIDKIFASRWEVNFIKLCEKMNEVVSLTHEPFGIPYITDKFHKYYPDFLVNNQVIVEIKPDGKLSDADVLLKKNVAEEFCQNNPQYSYVIITEKSLYSLRSGEITKSAQQELSKLLMI